MVPPVPWDLQIWCVRAPKGYLPHAGPRHMHRKRFLLTTIASVVAVLITKGQALTMSITKGYKIAAGATRNGEHFTMKGRTANTLDLKIGSADTGGGMAVFQRSARTRRGKRSSIHQLFSPPGRRPEGASPSRQGGAGGRRPGGFDLQEMRTGNHPWPISLAQVPEIGHEHTFGQQANSALSETTARV
jgi:hypothetical protein